MKQITAVLMFSLMAVVIYARPKNIREIETVSPKIRRVENYFTNDAETKRNEAFSRVNNRIANGNKNRELCKNQLHHEQSAVTSLQSKPGDSPESQENLKLQDEKSKNRNERAKLQVGNEKLQDENSRVQNENSKPQTENSNPGYEYSKPPCVMVDIGQSFNETGKDGVPDDDRIGTTVLISLGGPGK